MAFVPLVPIGDPLSKLVDERTAADQRARLGALEERLRARRAEIARTRKVPAYVIALDRTLVELATRRPRDRGALAAIYGFGPNRIEQYGDAFLEVLADA